MSDILISTIPGDLHARAVQWCLEKMGLRVTYLLATDFPAIMHETIAISNDKPELISIIGNDINVSGVPETIWRRRLGKPSIAANISPLDVPAAQAEAVAFVNGLQLSYDQPGYFCVNPTTGSFKVKSKITQLRVAKKVGLSIPDSLITNDPIKLKDFFDTKNGAVIIKSFTAPSWYSATSSFFPFSTKLTSELVANHPSISATPAIYQELVPKEFEVRTLFMGQEHISVRINSQNESNTKLDFRAGRKKIELSPFRLPEHVVRKCLLFMKEMNILTGSFDFVFTPNHEFIFLEVNEMGQFLWLEEGCPELPVLQTFAMFLRSKNRDFRWNGNIDSTLSFKSYLENGNFARFLELENSKHIPYSITGKIAYEPDSAGLYMGAFGIEG